MPICIHILQFFLSVVLLWKKNDDPMILRLRSAFFNLLEISRRGTQGNLFLSPKPAHLTNMDHSYFQCIGHSVLAKLPSLCGRVHSWSVGRSVTYSLFHCFSSCPCPMPHRTRLILLRILYRPCFLSFDSNLHAQGLSRINTHPFSCRNEFEKEGELAPHWALYCYDDLRGFKKNRPFLWISGAPWRSNNSRFFFI